MTVEHINPFSADIKGYPTPNPDQIFQLYEGRQSNRPLRWVLHHPIFDEGFRAAYRYAPDADEVMVLGNQGLVVSIAVKRKGINFSRDFEMEDLISFGNVGLVNAARGFDHQRGTAFVSYAGTSIRRAITAAIINEKYTARVSYDMQAALGMLYEFVDNFLELNEREPSDQELTEGLAQMDELPVTPTSIKEVYYSGITEVVSLDQLTPDGEIGPLPVPNNTDQELDQRLKRELMEKLLAGLNDREREIMTLRHGLVDAPLSLAEVGNRFGISKNRVAQIEQAALRKLRNNEEFKKDLENYRDDFKSAHTKEEPPPVKSFNPFHPPAVVK